MIRLKEKLDWLNKLKKECCKSNTKFHDAQPLIEQGLYELIDSFVSFLEEVSQGMSADKEVPIIDHLRLGYYNNHFSLSLEHNVFYLSKEGISDEVNKYGIDRFINEYVTYWRKAVGKEVGNLTAIDELSLIYKRLESSLLAP